jgi:hypothetical protein
METISAFETFVIRIILKCTSQFQIHAYSIFHVILLIFKVITICSSLFHVTNLQNGIFYIKYRTCLTCNVTVFTCNRCLNNYDFTATSYYTLDVVSRSLIVSPNQHHVLHINLKYFLFSW